jgi:acetylornithine deacetylase/succinyl-diaminopimelate desuccinylase family protein
MVDVEAVRGAVNEHRDELVALVRELVSHPSENPKLLTGAAAQQRATAAENACQDAVAAQLDALGLQIDRFEALPGRDDVVGRLAGAGGGRSLILNGHVDVVPAGDPAAWPHDPWRGECEGGRLWGRGACDMKGGIASGIIALRALRALGVRLAGDVVFQSVVDEETGGPGTHAAIARGHVADAAIVLEPTDRTIQIVEGGLEWLQVIVTGRTGHSAVRYRSVHAGGRGTAVSAIEKAAKLLAAVQELERHWGNTKVHPFLPRGITTINPGVIAGGLGRGEGGMPALMTAYSNFADHCVLGLSLKYLPGERAEDVKAELADYVARVANADPWLREHPPELVWGVGGVSFPPSEVAADHPLVTTLSEAFRAAAGEPRLTGFEAVSDLAWLAEAGVPAVLYGPGDFAQAHSSDEYVEIDELVEVARVVACAIADWCGADRG